VRTRGADREELTAASHQDHIIVTELSFNECPIRDPIDGHAMREVYLFGTFHVVGSGRMEA